MNARTAVPMDARSAVRSAEGRPVSLAPCRTATRGPEVSP